MSEQHHAEAEDREDGSGTEVDARADDAEADAVEQVATLAASGERLVVLDPGGTWPDPQLRPRLDMKKLVPGDKMRAADNAGVVLAAKMIEYQGSLLVQLHHLERPARARFVTDFLASVRMPIGRELYVFTEEASAFGQVKGVANPITTAIATLRREQVERHVSLRVIPARGEVGITFRDIETSLQAGSDADRAAARPTIEEDPIVLQTRAKAAAVISEIAIAAAPVLERLMGLLERRLDRDPKRANAGDRTAEAGFREDVEPSPDGRIAFEDMPPGAEAIVRSYRAKGGSVRYTAIHRDADFGDVAKHGPGSKLGRKLRDWLVDHEVLIFRNHGRYVLNPLYADTPDLFEPRSEPAADEVERKAAEVARSVRSGDREAVLDHASAAEMSGFALGSADYAALRGAVTSGGDIAVGPEGFHLTVSGDDIASAVEYMDLDPDGRDGAARKGDETDGEAGAHEGDVRVEEAPGGDGEGSRRDTELAAGASDDGSGAVDPQHDFPGDLDQASVRILNALKLRYPRWTRDEIVGDLTGYDVERYLRQLEARGLIVREKRITREDRKPVTRFFCRAKTGWPVPKVELRKVTSSRMVAMGLSASERALVVAMALCPGMTAEGLKSLVNRGERNLQVRKSLRQLVKAKFAVVNPDVDRPSVSPDYVVTHRDAEAESSD